MPLVLARSHPCYRFGLEAFEAGDQRPSPGDRRAHRRERKRGLVAGGAVPRFRDPERVRVGLVLGDHISETAGHRVRSLGQDRDQGVALARLGAHPADHAIQGGSGCRRARFRRDGGTGGGEYAKGAERGAAGEGHDGFLDEQSGKLNRMLMRGIGRQRYKNCSSCCG